jgi:hypothetical protein
MVIHDDMVRPREVNYLKC